MMWDVLPEVDEILNDNPFDLKDYFKRKLRDNSALFNAYWNVNGSQMTLLGYLISKYEPQNEAEDWSAVIEGVWQNHIIDKNKGAPVHQALAEGKIELARSFLKPLKSNSKQETDRNDEQPGSTVDLDARDIHGWTLLARALQTKDQVFILELCEKMADVNEVSLIEGRELAPIFQATLLDLPNAVQALMDKQAQLNQTCASEQHGLLMLGAKAGSVESLETLLDSEVRWDLEATDHEGKTAFALVCEALRTGRDQATINRYLQVAAILICHGAEISSEEEHLKTLGKHREKLLSAMGSYLLKHPQLTYKVIQVAQDEKNALHQVIYPKHPSIIFPLKLFKPQRHINSVSRQLANFVLEKDKSEKALQPLVEDAAASLEQDVEPADHDVTLWFANFVSKYWADIEKADVVNPRSGMYQALEKGLITTEDEVRAYARIHKNHRTADIIELVDKEFGLAPNDGSNVARTSF